MGFACLTLFFSWSAASADESDEATIGSLDGKTVQLRPGRVISGSSDLARENYRAFLDLVTGDPELRVEALRRLGDLELEASEAQQLAENIDALDSSQFDNAVTLYQQLLAAYPDYRRNDTVLYQLARAYETSGRTDMALDVLDDLVARFPDTALIDEAQFRRGEMLFLRKRYNEAEQAYDAVVAAGEVSRFHEQALYKLGWSRFKLAWHEDSFTPFFKLLDLKLDDLADIGVGERRLASLSRPERELVEDTFRVLSIGFSYMEGADSIGTFFQQNGSPSYGYAIYGNLGDLYLEKERFVDAAETYEAFVIRDPLHRQAPLLQAKVIESYKQGGFPTLVLDGKKHFVERYGMDSAFWQRHPVDENAEVATHLRSHLTDLAQYYHAEAQRDGNKSDYQQAADWYRKYLAYFPDDDDSANTNFLLAEILFESQDYEQATSEYERTAYGYIDHEKSAEAGFAAILSYREHEKALSGADRTDWHERYLDAGLKFADMFPEHPQSGAVLTTVAEDLFAQRQFDRAIAVGQAVIAKRPPVDANLARTAWTVIAHSQFDLGNFAEAEGAYYSLRTVTPVSDAAAAQEIKDRIASSIYKQGEQARDAGDLETAVGHFTRLGRAVPDSAIRVTAEYDAAAALINLQAWDRAAAVLEQFRLDYPDSEFADDVTRKLAVSYVESGQAERAALEFERIAVAGSSSDVERREALWKAASLYQQAGSPSNEQRVLTDIVARFPRPVAESIEARNRLLEIATQSGDAERRVDLLKDLVAADATAGPERTDRTRYLAARASLELAEPARQRFTAVRLTQPLANSLKVKKALMEEVIAAYTAAADYSVAEVTTAATYRLGEVYETLGADLLQSERPAELDAEALEQYELLLEEQAFPFEEKAIELYEANAARAPEGIFDEWVRRSFERLAGLMPARYAKEERSEDVITTLY
jgi:TolA-binding protein